MSANMNSFFEELVAAKQAMERVPDLEAKLAYSESEHRYALSRNDDFRQEIDRKNSQLLDMSSRIAKLEADLAQATFQGSEVRDQLQVLLSTLRGVVKEVNETVELVAPAPKPEVVVENPTLSVGTAGETAAGSEGSIVEDYSIHPIDGPLAPTIGEGISQGSIEVFGADMSKETGSGEATSNSPASGPFASSTDGQSVDVPPTGSDQSGTNSEPTVEPSAVASPPRYHEGKPYWCKPSAMPWLTWYNAGGLLPPWKLDIPQEPAL